MDSFFVIDSEHLDAVQTKLFGFSFLKGKLVTTTEELGDEYPESEGTYIYIRREGNKITISQDYVGCFGLYLYRDGDYYALGNSLHRVIDHVKGAHPITLNREYADYMLCADLCASIYLETMVCEITELDRCAVPEIDVQTGKITVSYTDYGENTVDPGTKEGLAILDSWRQKWADRIRGICSQTDYVRMDLSGGFDSREILMLFLSAGVDMNRIQVYTIADKLHTHTEDYEIATELAQRYGFKLNRPLGVRNRKAFTLQETWKLSFDAKLGVHQEMYFKEEKALERKYTFTGGGGECIRSYVPETEEAFTEKSVQRCERLYGQVPETCAEMQKSVRALFARTYQNLRTHYQEIGKPIREEEISQILYRETRNRNHFGKATLECWLAGFINLCPLQDPALRKLKLSSKNCADMSLITAILLGRYYPELAEIRFDSKKKVNPETLTFVKELCREYPAPMDGREKGKPENGTERAAEEIKKELKDRVPLPVPDAELKKAILSGPFRKQFEKAYDPEIYRIIREDMEKRKFHPLKFAYIEAGIVKILQDQNARRKMPMPYTEWLEKMSTRKPGVSAKERMDAVKNRLRGGLAYRGYRKIRHAAAVIIKGQKKQQ